MASLFFFAQHPSPNPLITIWLSLGNHPVPHPQPCDSDTADPTPVPTRDGHVTQAWPVRVMHPIEYGDWFKERHMTKVWPIWANTIQFHGLCWSSWDGGVFCWGCWTVVWKPRATGSYLATMRRQSLENGVYLEGKQREVERARPISDDIVWAPKSRPAWSQPLDFSVIWPINSFSP